MVQCVALAGIALCAASYLLKTHQWLLFYPGGRQPCDAGRVRRFTVDRDAAGRTAGAPARAKPAPEGVRYTRKVTLVWCGFFIGNGAMALFTVLHGDMHLWTLWNGMVAYILMGTLMATEWLCASG